MKVKQVERIKAHKPCVDEIKTLLNDNYAFNKPATEAELQQLELSLNVPLPWELRDLLALTNGVISSDNKSVLFSTFDIQAVNKAVREESAYIDKYMPLDEFLFFGSNSKDNLFGFRILKNEVCQFVFEWDRKFDHRICRSTCLNGFYGRLLDSNEWDKFGSYDSISNAKDTSHQTCVSNILKDLENYCDFDKPAEEEAITNAEKHLGVSFPHEMKKLYKATNGIYEGFAACGLFSLDKLVSENSLFRNSEHLDLYNSVEPLLLFGAEGNGDYYCFPIIQGEVDNAVVHWDHESDDRIKVASCLGAFLVDELEPYYEELEDDECRSR